MDYKNKKCLVAYYSRKGKNYVNGGILDLAIGNTQIAAEMVKKLTNADLFEIDTIKKYPLDYQETTRIAEDELRCSARPELTDRISYIGQYEIIFLGYPNWWGTMPMGVWTFLESYDLDGKIILPFCTHEGSGMGQSERDIRKLCPNADVKTGIAIRGSQVKSAETDIAYWLNK